MDALKHNRFDVARITLQTLINTYPDSEFLARAKLAVADSWYAEGSTAALAQAEAEYNDFITFFPNMPEAAEAQLKIANIHYQEMEKPDRDFTHALRAEEEYRKVILQYPDNPKMVALAKQRLLQVQEVIAEREFRVGRFYFLRGSYPASIARLKSLVDTYPLYSKADEALYLLGQAYESEIAMLRQSRMQEAAKARMIEEFTKGAAEAYSKILTRYPVMDRADDAKARLIDLHQPVPKPTKAAIARNRAEENSRHEDSTMARVMKAFSHHPDFSDAATVGEPTLVDPKPVSATDIEKEASRAMIGGSSTGTSRVAGEIVGTGTPPPNEDAPRSDAPPSDPASPDTATPAASDPAAPAGAQPTPGELTPNVAPDPNELKPNASSSDGNQPAPPPQQINEIQPQAGAAPTAKAADASSSGGTKDDQDSVSSSKHKKKKGLKKIIPF
jgi:outer membrane protein assembly factor BamD